MTRPARVYINSAALLHNYQRVRTLAPHARIMAIVKADAYGHGLTTVAKLLTQADAFGVACLEEAQTLRDAGVSQPIVLLEGIYQATELDQVSALELDMVIHCQVQLEMLSHYPAVRQRQLWLKFDTGMHRLGFPPDALPAVLGQCDALGLHSPPRLMSHLAAAGEPENTLNRTQRQCFEALRQQAGLAACLANSAALLDDPETHYDWVRPGLILYGASPFPDRQGAQHGLQAVMTLESELIEVRQLKAQQAVGYGATWHTPTAMPIGIAAIGYADGYPRHAPSGTPVLVQGHACALAGRVSMDMLAVDLRNFPTAKAGDTIQLWGPELPVERIATAAGTIPHALLSNVHKRLHFHERRTTLG